MRIGIRLAITGLVLASIMVSAIGVHLLWWRTAEANSHALAATIDEQIVSAVRKGARHHHHPGARRAHRDPDLVCPERAGDPRGRQARVRLSLATAGAAGHILGGVRLAGRRFLRRAQARRSRPGNDGNRPVDGVRQAARRRISRSWSATSSSRSAGSKTPITTSPIRNGIEKACRTTSRAGSRSAHHPVGLRPSIAYAGPIDVYQKRQGVLAVIIENTRLAQFLSQLSVGKTGAAFILGRDGARRSPRPIRMPTKCNMQRRDQPLLPIAQGAMKTGRQLGRDRREVGAGCGWSPPANAYAVTLTPLGLSRLDARDRHSGGGVSGPDRNDDPAAC